MTAIPIIKIIQKILASFSTASQDVTPIARRSLLTKAGLLIPSDT